MVAQRSCLLLVAFAVTLTAASSVLPADSAPVSNGTAPSPSPAPAPGNHTDPCGPGECSGLGCLFVDVTCANVVPMNFGGTVQLLFLTLVYAYLLFFASNLISDGSELLLLFPSIKGLVGSVVLPVLGAVPDGAIVLFAGLGQTSRLAAQTNIAVGVGALAGSTIMLLTIPWFIAVWFGRVDLDAQGNAAYSRRPHLRLTGNSRSMTRTGVSPTGAVKSGGILMMVTSLSYLVIQIPAFAFMGEDSKVAPGGSALMAKDEQTWALVGMISCVLLLFGYLAFMVRTANHDAKVENAQKARIVSGDLKASHVFESIVDSYAAGAAKASGAHAPLNRSDSMSDPGTVKKIDGVLKHFFVQYDRDKSNTIDRVEMRLLFADLNENLTDAEFDAFMARCDANGDQEVDYEEFRNAMVDYATTGKFGHHQGPVDVSVNNEGGEGDEEEDHEEEEMPEDIASLPKEAQMRALKIRSAWQMAVGTIMVVLVSDPMVDCLNEIGVRTSIPGFYIAFVIAPLASNAAELIAAYNYAIKKTRKDITISLSTLTGAACMNNTFCLGIFLALMYFVKIDGAPAISWDFSSETISILFVQIVMFVFASRKSTPLWCAFVIVSLFPLSIILVVALDAAGLH